MTKDGIFTSYREALLYLIAGACISGLIILLVITLICAVYNSL